MAIVGALQGDLAVLLTQARPGVTAESAVDVGKPMDQGLDAA